jgi:SAM-dependent methyltransferase
LAHIDKLVYDYYQTPGVAESWSRASSLLLAEESLLDEFRSLFASARVLDIGVGPGRTLPHLRDRCRHYIGIDYSERMLLPCRLRHPESDLLLCDARRLSFRSASFDVVLFLYNAIDDACHEDRIAILNDIHRVLGNDGFFLFSGHNTDGGIKPPESPGDLANHLGRKELEIVTPDYSVLNDSSHNYKLLTYYMTSEQQIRQLAGAGFTRISVRALDGRELAPGERCTDALLHYVSWKA